MDLTVNLVELDYNPLVQRPTDLYYQVTHGIPLPELEPEPDVGSPAAILLPPTYSFHKHLRPPGQ